MALTQYKSKRDFRRTSEPKARVSKRASQQRELLFVIQKHAARRLHYDFRLEMEGVLKSWAVPKGIPTRRGEKHLAVHVEDHPMDYARFEGTIPEGNYGAGTVMVWDIGSYTVSGDDPLKALEQGKIHLALAGRKLKGEWTLVKTRRSAQPEKEEWLLMKTGADEPSLSAKQEDESALSKRSMTQIAKAGDAEWISDRPAGPRKIRPRPQPALPQEIKALPKSKPAFISPMKCRVALKPPAGKEWVFEIKFDGIRAIAIKAGEAVQIFSRAGNSLAQKFPEVVSALKRLPCGSGVVDGEIVAVEESGRSSFQLLQAANMPGEERPPILFYAFDLLNLEGRELKSLPLNRRKELLQQILPADDPVIKFSASLVADPEDLLAEIRSRGLEGLIGKKSGSKYEPGLRTGAWIKLKCVNEQEFVIGGYTRPQGSRQHFGALLVGYYEKDRLLFASKVGTGFDMRLLESLYKKLKKIEQTDCPFANLPEQRSGRYGQGITASQMRQCTWVEPKLVCQVHFTEWTRDGHLRHPSFIGLREDRAPGEVVRETQ
jgi:bifunctional non-homologous end joining protein LigD